MAGDGQVSLGPTVMKHTAKKVRKLYHDRVIAGFAGATADAFTLFELFEPVDSPEPAAAGDRAPSPRLSLWP